MASDFGQGLKRTADSTPADGPAPQMQKREATKLENWKWAEMLEFNTKVFQSAGDVDFILPIECSSMLCTCLLWVKRSQTITNVIIRGKRC